MSVYELIAVSGMDANATAFERAAMLTFAPCKGEIHRVQIEDLCDGCISLSNGEYPKVCVNLQTDVR